MRDIPFEKRILGLKVALKRLLFSSVLVTAFLFERYLPVLLSRRKDVLSSSGKMPSDASDE
jgi:hypothetical protein